MPFWTNEFNDGFGGLMRDGRIGFLYIKDEREPSPLPPLAQHVRAEAASSDLAPTAELVRSVLDREGL